MANRGTEFGSVGAPPVDVPSTISELSFDGLRLYGQNVAKESKTSRASKEFTAEQEFLPGGSIHIKNVDIDSEFGIEQHAVKIAPGPPDAVVMRSAQPPGPACDL